MSISASEWRKNFFLTAKTEDCSYCFSGKFHFTAPVIAKGFDLAVLRSFRGPIISAKPEVKKPLAKRRSRKVSCLENENDEGNHLLTEQR